MYEIICGINLRIKHTNHYLVLYIIETVEKILNIPNFKRNFKIPTNLYIKYINILFIPF